MIEDTKWVGEVTGKTHQRLKLYTWYELTKEYIFERTVKDVKDAKRGISQLKRDGFL
jgi:hypothetical protein